METKATKLEKALMGVCLGSTVFLLCMAVLTFFARAVLAGRLGIDNALTDLILSEDARPDSGDAGGPQDVYINWSRLYPFAAEAGEARPEAKRTVVDRYTALVELAKRAVDQYLSDYLFGYRAETELARKYDAVIGWNFASFGEYNAIVELPDGYLSQYIPPREVSEYAESLAAFQTLVKEQGTEFLFVMLPYKISEYDDGELSGYADFSNQNADELLEKLRDRGVGCLDLREQIHAEGLRNHPLFFRTDHHWLTTTGLWGAQRILRYCNEQYGFRAETELLDLDRFSQVVYPDWFLGSQGKKLTLSRAAPEDFTLLYPDYPTEFHYVIPSKGIDVTGDYSVVYDMSQLAERNYYRGNPYGACNYGDQAVLQIDSALAADDKKILMIHDSFGDCLVSCLALCEERVDALDLRKFNGSVARYVEEAAPDIVIVMYCASSVGGEIQWETHTDTFDFR